MLSTVALLLVQDPLTPEQIHEEDSKVFEVATLAYWKQGRPESPIIYIPDRTGGPIRWGDPIIDNGFDAKGSRTEKVEIDPTIRENLIARNAFPVSLAWFKPESAKIKLVYPNELKDRWTRRELRQYTWLQMPGYSKNRSRAIVCLGFNWSIHSGRASVWLDKEDGQWKVTQIRDVHYV